MTARTTAGTAARVGTRAGAGEAARAATAARGRGPAVGVALVAGAVTLAAGVWSLTRPASFADAVGFPVHEHFLHDIGAFQLGLAAMLLLGCVWYDALATALAAFLVANGVHTVNHAVDLDHGGEPWHIAALAALTAAVAAALWARLRGLGWVVGGVEPATRPELAPYVRQKTVLLTTYKRDGGSGSSPLSIAVDGDRAYMRSFHTALKTRRVRHDPRVRFTPSTALGKPLPGAEETPARLVLLERGGTEERRAVRTLRRKYPLLHGVMVPVMHRTLLRRKTRGTVHFAVVLEEGPS